MAKSKQQVKTGKAKSEVQTLSKVKNASVTKPSQTPNAKSKQIAREVASKAVNGKADKKLKKVAPPSSDEDSEDESEASSDSESSDDSDAEVDAKKPVAATNGKLNGTSKAKKEEVDSSDSSDSSGSSDSSSASDSDSSSGEKSAAEDSQDSSEESESESEEAVPVTSAAKKVIKKTADAGKAVVNGAAKAVAMATETSDEEDSNEPSSDDDEEEEDESSDSDDSSDASESASGKEEKETSKKRKADAEPAASAKKAKKETPADVEDNGTKNLFVGNLSWNVDDEWLYREFEEFGELTGARVVTDRESGRSKGFGYVEFAKSSDAAAALKAKKDALIDGRAANVDFSTPRDNTAPKDRAEKRAQNYGDSKNPESDTLFVGNLSFEANEDIVGEAFGEHGAVTNVRLPTDIESGNPKGFGYVTFVSVVDAKKAYENMMGAEIAGRPVRLDYATPRPDRSGGGGRGGRGGFGDRGGRGGRGGGRGGRGGFGDRGGRGGSRGGRGGSTNRGGFGDFKGQKKTFS